MESGKGIALFLDCTTRIKFFFQVIAMQRSAILISIVYFNKIVLSEVAIIHSVSFLKYVYYNISLSNRQGGLSPCRNL